MGRCPRRGSPSVATSSRELRLPRQLPVLLSARNRRAKEPYDACTCDWETRLETLFAQVVDPRKVAAIFIEPIIGEGGYIVPPPGFLPRLREIADRHGILLVADEVQSGFGRTGRFFAFEHWGIVPDVIVMAKGIASGLPLSGILAHKATLAKWAPGAHGGTYGGNVVSCAAANATLDVIEQEGLVANAEARGRQLLDGLRAVGARHRTVGDVRGLGLMVGIEFVDPASGDPRKPNPDMVKKVVAGALDRKLILLTCGSFGQVVRLIPPLVTTAEEIDQAVAIDRRRHLGRRARLRRVRASHTHTPGPSRVGHIARPRDRRPVVSPPGQAPGPRAHRPS